MELHQLYLILIIIFFRTFILFHQVTCDISILMTRNKVQNKNGFKNQELDFKRPSEVMHAIL